MSAGSWSRRKFLHSSLGVIGSAATVGILPRTALADKAGTAPSNKIVMGFIGLGGMGTGNLKGFLAKPEVFVAAVCDVDRKHLSDAKKIVDGAYGNNDCAAYNDFREITRRDDIDAVCVCTPDHWHTIPAVDAAKHGKDAYVEKPLTLTIREGRILSDTVRRYGRILQTGSQQRSDQRFRRAAELVRNGRLGKIDMIEVRIPANNKECTPTWAPEPIPEELDYDLWLGQAPSAPYHSQRCHYQFRFILDYSGGQVTNWGAHYLDIAQWALGMDDSGPVAVEGIGEFPKTGLFTTAVKVHFECLYSTGTRVVCKTREDGVGDGSIRFAGSEGRLYVDRGKITSEPASILQEEIRAGEIRLYESVDHQQNFLDCVKDRRRPVADVEVGHRTATVCHLGNIAMLLGRKLKWDPTTESFPNDDEANALVGRAQRSPWCL